MSVLHEPATRDWDFPRDVGGIRVLVEHGASRGMAASEVLAGTGLADLEAGQEVTPRQELRAVRNLQARLGPGAGAQVGARYRAATFGVFGFALVTSRTVVDAMNVALRFIDLSFAFAIPTAAIEGERVVVTVDGAGLPPDVRTFLVHRDATAIHAVLDELVPGGVGGTLGLGEERATLEFGVGELDRPIPQRDASTLALAEQLCLDVVSRRRARTGLTQEVRVLVTQRLPAGAPMSEVCRELGLSESSLRRRLREEGVGYQVLLDEVRAALATELLSRRSSLPLDVVADRLGYSGATSFIHAFKRWTGRTPRSGGN